MPGEAPQLGVLEGLVGGRGEGDVQDADYGALGRGGGGGHGLGGV